MLKSHLDKHSAAILNNNLREIHTGGASVSTMKTTENWQTLF